VSSGGAIERAGSSHRAARAQLEPLRSGRETDIKFCACRRPTLRGLS
jgi:hypothetical protein